LLDSRDIMGAKKILLSIISGEEAELQMDELSTITEYIQSQAGDEAEVIFGHGVDAQLSDRIRVTVIATGFTTEFIGGRKPDEKKVLELDRNQISLFNQSQPQVDNSVNQVIHEPQLKIQEQPVSSVDKDKPVLDKPILDKPILDKPILEKPVKKEEPVKEEPHRIYTLFEKPAQPKNEEDNGDDGLFGQDDEFSPDEISSDQFLNDEGMMDYRKTKERLQQQAKERRERLKANKNGEMTKEEFKEKWEQPAYKRRGVKMDNIPHSSEPLISRYNLNDDNNILGNNKFLHDNVD
jgi:cell division protein FtsZ